MSQKYCEMLEKKESIKRLRTSHFDEVKEVFAKYLPLINTEGVLSDTIMYMMDKKRYLTKKQKGMALMIIDAITKRIEEGIESEPGDGTGLDGILLTRSNIGLDKDLKNSLLDYVTARSS